MEMQDVLEPLQKTNTSSADVKSLVNTLKNACKTFQVFTSTPNGDSIPTDKVFQGVSFTLTKAGNDDNIISSSEMIETLFGNEQNFVFIDDGEYGRKAFMQYVCSGLCVTTLDKNIVLYVNLKGLDRKMTIAEAIDTQMNSDGIVSTKVIRNILKNKKCLLVFDEVHELNQSPVTLHSKNQHHGEITINDVLSGTHFFQKYQNMRLLCISKNKINVTSCFPKSQVCIRITPFSLATFKSYVASIFNCYKNFDQTNTKKSSEETEGTGDEGNNLDKSSVIDHTYDEQYATYVTNLILDKENIIKQIDMCPSSIILFTHALVSDISKKAIENLRFYIHRRSYLTRLILNCLQFENSLSHAKCVDFELLMLNFGQASFEKSLEDTSFTEKCNLISEYTRRQLETRTSEADFATAFGMGLLKVVTTGDCSTEVTENDLYPSPDSLIEFRHQYIQEYFTARAIASNKTVSKRFLKSPALKKNDRMKRVLQFMHGTEAQYRHELLKQLVEEKNWNNLIDFLFECENNDDFKSINLAKSSITGKYPLNITNMDNLYHGMAVEKFCKALDDHNVSLEALAFWRPCEFKYFSKLEIPKVKLLVFFEIDVQEGNNFIAFVKKAFEMNFKGTIRFVKCRLPEEINKDEMQKIADLIQLADNAPKIYRIDSVKAEAYEQVGSYSNSKLEKLNIESGCWEAN